MSADSPAAISYHSDGYIVSVQQGALYNATNARAFAIAGFDGANWRILSTGQVGVQTSVVGAQNVIPTGRYNATRLVLADTNYANLQMDGYGNTWTRDGYQPVYEDNTNGVAASQVLPLASTTYSYTNAQGIAALPGNIKSTAGNLFCVSVYNANASARFLQIFNSSGAPSGTPLMTYLIPGTGQIVLGSDYFGPGGFSFSTGITLGVSTAAGTYTAATAGETYYTVGYK